MGYTVITAINMRVVGSNGIYRCLKGFLLRGEKGRCGQIRVVEIQKNRRCVGADQFNWKMSL